MLESFTTMISIPQLVLGSAPSQLDRNQPVFLLSPAPSWLDACVSVILYELSWLKILSFQSLTDCNKRVSQQDTCNDDDEVAVSVDLPTPPVV